MGAQGRFMDMSRQIESQIDVSLTERDRTSAFFRVILAIPMAIFISSFTASGMDNSSSGYIAVGFFVLPVALAIVVRQIYPTYLLAFNKAFLSLQTRLNAYFLLLTDDYPTIEENEIVSVSFPEVDAKTLNRWLPLIKWFLAIPLYVVGAFYIIYALILTIIAWFSILFTGTYPEKSAEGVVGMIAYWNRVIGYALLMVTDEYPSFSL